MRCRRQFLNRNGTNNVNICINVNKYGNDNSNFDSITYLHDKVTSLTSDLNTLSANVMDLTSLEGFEQNLNNFFDVTEREKIKSLINNQAAEKLNQFITHFEEFNSLIQPNSKLKYKETIVYLNEYNSENQQLITASIDGESVIINDITDSDNDPKTKYKIPIEGFIIGMEIYFTRISEENWAENWISYNGLDTIYNSETKLSYIFLEEENFEDIFDENRPNNKLKVYSLEIE